MAVGLPVPRWLCDIFSLTVGGRNAENLLPLGATFSAHKAKSIRLVDEIFDSNDLMKEAAVAQLEHCFRVNQGVRHKTMQWIRREFSAKMRREESLDCMSVYLNITFPDIIIVAAVREAGLDPEFQKTIRKLIASLSAKKNHAKSNL